MRRSKLKVSVLLVVLGLTSVVGYGCDPGFDSVSEVEDFRLLAIRTEPPEHIYKVAIDDKGMPQVDPVSLLIPQVSATLLLASPGQEKTKVSYRLEGCILDNNLECLEGKARSVFAEGAEVPGEIGLTLTLPLDLIAQSFEADPYFGIFGAAVWLSGEVVQAEVTIPFLKAFILSPDYGQGRDANTNPTILGILEGEKDEEVSIELDAEGVYRAEAGKEYRLLVDIAAADRETYVVKALALSTLVFSQDTKIEEVMDLAYDKELTEDLTINFHSSCGGLSVESKSEELHILFETEEDKKDKDLSVIWTAPEKSDNCDLWFVATDGRGGVGWYSLSISVE